MLDWIHNAYDIVNQLSVTSLVAIAVIFSVALLLAVREAAAWFFKVDDVKRDVRALYDLVLELEGEIRALQTTLSRENGNMATSTNTAQDREETAPPLRPEIKTELKPSPAKAFPIVH